MIEQLTNVTTGRRASRAMHTADKWALFGSDGHVAHSEMVPKLIAQAWVDGKIDRDEAIRDLVPSPQYVLAPGVDPTDLGGGYRALSGGTSPPAVNGDLRADLRWISKSVAHDRDLIHSLAVDVLALLSLVESLTERIDLLEKRETGDAT